jgi:hypothetical protein
MDNDLTILVNNDTSNNVAGAVNLIQNHAHDITPRSIRDVDVIKDILGAFLSTRATWSCDTA